MTRMRTDWPVWAVLAVSALAGLYVGWHYGVGWGIAFGALVLVGLKESLLRAEASGRRDERNRRVP